jgi:hypothetical protein
MLRNIKEKEGHYLTAGPLTIDLPMCEQTRNKQKAKTTIEGHTALSKAAS